MRKFKLEPKLRDFLEEAAGSWTLLQLCVLPRNRGKEEESSLSAAMKCSEEGREALLARVYLAFL